VAPKREIYDVTAFAEGPGVGLVVVENVYREERKKEWEKKET